MHTTHCAPTARPWFSCRGAMRCAQMGFLVTGLVLWHGRSSRLLLLRQISDQSLCGEDHSSNTGRILKSGTGYFGRIGNTGLEHILVLVGQYVETEVLVVTLFLTAAHTLDYDRAILTTIDGKLAQRLFKSAAQDVHTSCGITFKMQAVQCLDSIQQSNAAAGNHTLFHTCASSGECVLNAGLAILQLDLGASANLDQRYATGELRQALLQLLAIIIAGRFLDLSLDLADASLDVCGLSITLDNGRVILGSDNGASGTKIDQRRAIETAAHLLADDLS